MSRLEVAFGFGALLKPVMSGLLIANVSWIWSFAIVIVFAIINLILWSKKPDSPKSQQTPALHAEALDQTGK
ncbi:hypothetical protein ASF12_16745 [Paenibacillus sp. Leaf72]|nr:hypothetical protein ASF12_16745 [Paenibacillus sp. Leaf72]